MRNAQVFVIVGGRGSGKTTFLERTLKKEKAVIIELVKTDRYNGFTDRYFYEDIESGFINMKKLANKQIVFEDATSYINSNMKNSLKKLIVFSKQIGSDVFVVFHSINIIPPFLWNLFNYLIIFKCPEPHQTAANKEYFKDIQKICKKLQTKRPFKPEILQSNA